MIFQLINLGGYGQFVWPAFIFTFVSCLYLYLKTKNERKVQEKLFFLEFNTLKNKKIQFSNVKESTKEVLTAN